MYEHSKRNGAVVVAALVCLTVVVAVVASMIQGALLARRQLRVQRDLRQTELLLQAGAERAAAKLQQDDAYRGETWRIDGADLLGLGDGEVKIEVDARGAAHLAAEYPVGDARSVRRTATFALGAKDQGDSARAGRSAD